MNYTVLIQSEAVNDTREAFDWYEAQQPGLGYEYLEEVENGYEKLSNQPLHYSFINERFRKLKVARFPYVIIYEIEDNRVIIVSVWHTSIKPKF